MNVNNNPRDILYTKLTTHIDVYKAQATSFSKALSVMRENLFKGLTPGRDMRYRKDSHSLVPSSIPPAKELTKTTYESDSLNDYAIHLFFTIDRHLYSPNERALVSDYLEKKLASTDGSYNYSKIGAFYEKILTGKFKSPEEKLEKQNEKQKKAIEARIAKIHETIAERKSKLTLELITEKEKKEYLQELDKAPSNPHIKPFKELFKTIIEAGTGTMLTMDFLKNKGFDISRGKNLLTSHSSKKSPLYLLLEKIEYINAALPNFEKNMSKFYDDLDAAEQELKVFDKTPDPEQQEKTLQVDLGVPVDKKEFVTTPEPVEPAQGDPSTPQVVQNVLNEDVHQNNHDEHPPIQTVIEKAVEIDAVNAEMPPQIIETKQSINQEQVIPVAIGAEAPAVTPKEQKKATEEIEVILPEELLSNEEEVILGDGVEQLKQKEPLQSKQSFFRTIFNALIAIPSFIFSRIYAGIRSIGKVFWG